MDEENGRSAHFHGGSEAVRAPRLYTMQNEHPRAFAPQSVLDNLFPSWNGQGAPDYERSKFGLKGSSVGQSESTFDKQVFIRDRQTAARQNFGDKNG